MATAAIVMDAAAAGSLVDDRAAVDSFADELKRISELRKSWPRAA